MNSDPFILEWTNLLGDFVGYRFQYWDNRGFWDVSRITHKTREEAQISLEKFKRIGFEE
jgi:hypothetical protein